MRILVTGGAGFVGSHIADGLLAGGHEVIVLDDMSSGVDFAPKAAERWLGDMRSATWTARDIDAVVHAAAYAELRHNWTAPHERARLLQSNVEGTTAVLEAMPDVPVVYLSTAAVYGSGYGGIEATERTTPRCESPYAATKLAGEALVQAYAHKRGIPWHVLRLVNVVGARTHRGVIVDFVQMMREKGAIHAADDGRQTKPWVHVSDVADAVSMCLTPFAGPATPPSGVYNVTSRELVSWRDVVIEMGVPMSSVTWEHRDRGAVGDPHNLRVSGDKLSPYVKCQRPIIGTAADGGAVVRGGIREALTSLGWEMR